LDRRIFLQSGAATALLTLPADKLPAALQGDRQAEGASLFANLRAPDAASRPQIRWWWPGGAIDPEEVRKEVADIAAAGFGGFEIADVRDSIQFPIDPVQQGWGSPAWQRGVQAALEEAARHGLSPSLTMGPHWPTGIPGIVPDDDAASKELVHGEYRLSGGQSYSGPVPPPLQAKPSGATAGQNENPPVTPKLIAVQAMRIVEAIDGAPPVLDPATLTDLRAHVAGDRLDWIPPARGDWIILGFWARGTGQIQNMFTMNKATSMLASPTPYVLDIYGPAAVRALTEYWDRHLLPPSIRSLMRQTGGTFFEDSLEMAAACPWTPTALEAFTERRGYDLKPYLALLVSRQPSMAETILSPGRPALFRLAGVTTARVRHDYESMLSDMYIDNRLKGLSRWASGLGMNFRVQAIGSDINAGLAAAIAPIPEGDNSNDIHGWRQLAAGRDIGRHRILSNEAGTFVKGHAHAAVWRDLLYMLHRDMAGGANQTMMHGYSYADAPGATWPGFSAFGRAIGNDWGPRDPNWTMAPGITAYLGRLQALLRQGQTRCDLAILGAPLQSQSVLHAGYTFQYPAMELFDWPAMRLSGGRLMADGPAYRAIVLNAVPSIDLSVARRLLAHAKAGFPILIVGAAPRQARGWKAAEAQDREISAIMDALRRLPCVKQVATQKDVPAALKALGIEGRIRFGSTDRVLTLHRETAEGHLLYLLNDQEEATKQGVSLALKGTPYLIDLWSGDIAAMDHSPDPDGTTEITLSLAPNEPAMLLVAPHPPAGARILPREDGLAGHRKAVEGWDVLLRDWRAGKGVNGIDVQDHRLRLDTLVPWSDLPGREGMAGVALYTGHVRIDGESISANAILDLGRVEGTASLSVNGSPARIVNPFSLRARIGPLLKSGDNRIEIMVASSLNNRLLADGIKDQAFAPMADGDGPAMPPPPKAAPVPDRDMIDGPPRQAGMQPGADLPGGTRTYKEFGLIGSVTLTL